MTDITGDLVHLDDLAVPRFGADVQEIRDFMSLMALDLRLDADALHAQARAETGLDDFGGDGYRERLDVYLAALDEIEGLDGPGVVNVHSQLLQWLKNRLLMTDLLARHPEIHDVDLAPPIVIAGLPRTGTTHLHNLLGAAPAFRTLPYWESFEPFPLPAEAGVRPDPRRDRMDLAVGFMNAAMPHFKLMHEMTTDHVHEEIQLLANDFSSMLMETLAHVPRWRDHYLAHDQTPHYEHLRTQLHVLTWLRRDELGERRWLLKSPQHLEQLPVLDRVFPGVTVVCTHRDPVPVVLSMVAMLVYSARMHRSPVPVEQISRDWVDRLEVMLGALLRDRDAIPPDRSIDVRFDDFMADDLAVAERVFALAGDEPTAADRDAMGTYLAGHQRGRLGRIATSAEMFGLDEADLRRRFTPYVERFLS